MGAVIAGISILFGACLIGVILYLGIYQDGGGIKVGAISKDRDRIVRKYTSFALNLNGYISRFRYSYIVQFKHNGNWQDQYFVNKQWNSDDEKVIWDPLYNRSNYPMRVPNIKGNGYSDVPRYVSPEKIEDIREAMNVWLYMHDRRNPLEQFKSPGIFTTERDWGGIQGVQPMAEPNGQLMYLDYQYGGDANRQVTVDQLHDINRTHGIDAVAEIENILVNELGDNMRRGPQNEPIFIENQAELNRIMGDPVIVESRVRPQLTSLEQVHNRMIVSDVIDAASQIITGDNRHGMANVVPINFDFASLYPNVVRRIDSDNGHLLGNVPERPLAAVSGIQRGMINEYTEEGND